MEARAGGAIPRFVGFVYTLAKIGPAESFTGRRWNGVEWRLRFGGMWGRNCLDFWRTGETETVTWSVAGRPARAELESMRS